MVLRLRDGQLIVRFNQRRECVFVRWRVGAVDVALHGSGGGSTPVGEFANELVALQLRGRCRLHKLLQEFGSVLGFGDASREFPDWR